MKIGHSVRRPRYDSNLAGYKLRECVCEGDLGVDVPPNLSLGHHVRGIVQEAISLLANSKIAFKYLENLMFRVIFTTCISSELECAFRVWSLHFHKHLREKVRRRTEKKNMV